MIQETFPRLSGKLRAFPRPVPSIPRKRNGSFLWPPTREQFASQFGWQDLSEAPNTPMLISTPVTEACSCHIRELTGGRHLPITYCCHRSPPQPPWVGDGSRGLAWTLADVLIQSQCLLLPSQKLPKQKPTGDQTSSQDPHRLLGLALAVWLARGVRLLGDRAGQDTSTSTPFHRGRRGERGGGHHSHKRALLLRALRELKHVQQRREARAPLLTVCIRLDSPHHSGLLGEGDGKGR